jgi:hypothetical protein
MRLLCIVSFLALSVVWMQGAGSSGGQKDRDGNSSGAPVLRSEEPEGDVIVRLPGPAPAPLAATRGRTGGSANGRAGDGASEADAAPSSAASAGLAALNARQTAIEDSTRPLLRHIYPPSFATDSAIFCQKLIGHWTEDDARFLLGEPVRQRPSLDAANHENGEIFAFTDPTGRYKELELDFEAGTGTLRTVFAYPFRLMWSDCRRVWGGNVTATTAAQGRKFYSYLNRRMDVLVDTGGKVISVGLY